MSRFRVIGFDADDTLWHNERLYVSAQARFRELLAHYHSAEWIDERLYQAEMRNLPHFGYDMLLQRHGIPPQHFLMAGNSLRSDILPVLALGASAVCVPYTHTWAHEVAERPPVEQPGYYELEHLGQLPGLLERLESLSGQALKESNIE